jgi:PAS domain S-box-containing protein
MPLWPPPGILLGFLLIECAGRRSCFVATAAAAALPFEIFALHRGAGVACLLFLFNVAQASFGVLLLQNLSHPPFLFQRVRQTFALIGVAATVAFASVFIGVASTHFAGGLREPILTAFLSWVAEVLGIILLTPMIVSWLGPRRPLETNFASFQQTLEAAALMAGLVVTTVLLFARPVGQLSALVAYPFLVISFLFWAATRLGTLGTSIASLTLCLIAIQCTKQGLGPFSANGETSWNDIFALETLLCIATGSSLLLASTIHERVLHQDEIRILNSTLETNVELRTAQLRASEERYQTLAATAPVGIIHCDSSGIARYVNERWCNITGTASTRVVGSPWLSAVHPEDIRSASSRWEAAQYDNLPFAMEFRFRTPRGETRWVFGQFARERGPRGEDPGFVGTVTDISERKAAEDKLQAAHDKLEFRVHQRTTELYRANLQLQEGEKRIRRVIDSAYDAFISVNEHGFITDWNPQATSLFGWNRSEVVGQPLSERIVPASGGEELASKLHHYLTAEHNHAFERMEAVAARRDGSTFPAELTISTIPEGETHFLSMFLRDITARKAVEKATRESESLLRSFFDSTTLMMGVVEIQNQDIIVLSANSSAEKQLKAGPGPLVGRAASTMNFSKQEIEIWLEYFRDSSALRKPVKFEFRKNNREYIATVCHAMTTPAGVDRYSFVLEDITERLESQQELIEKTIALENAAEGIARIDSQGRHVSVNRAYEENTGHLPGELTSREWLESIHPQDIAKMRVAYQTMLTQGKVDVETRVLRKDGVTGYREQTMVSTYNREGQFAGHYNFVRDITQRKRAEQERDRFFTMSLDMLCIAQTNGYFRRLNPAFERTLGYSVAELMAAPFITFVHPDDQRKTGEMFSKLRRGVPCVAFENRYRCRDGSYRWLSWTASPVVGEHVVYAVARDVTQQKEAAEALVVSLEEKEVLLKEIHHRVKNNLQIVSSLLQLQSDHILDEKTRQTFQESQNRIRSMALIHERLYQNGSLARVDFGEYSSQLLTMLMRSYSTQPGRVTLETEIDNIGLGIDTAVPVGLITNEIISNSLKYAFPGSRCGKVTVSLHKGQENSYELKISDTGVGMAKGVPRDKSPTLGFRLIKILTRQIGGNIEFATGEGGTTVQLDFRDSK